jgi:hypothetical protein
MIPLKNWHQQMRATYLVSHFLLHASNDMPRMMLFLGAYQVVVDKIPWTERKKRSPCEQLLGCDHHSSCIMYLQPCH